MDPDLVQWKMSLDLSSTPYDLGQNCALVKTVKTFIVDSIVLRRYFPSSRITNDAKHDKFLSAVANLLLSLI